MSSRRGIPVSGKVCFGALGADWRLMCEIRASSKFEQYSILNAWLFFRYPLSTLLCSVRCTLYPVEHGVFRTPYSSIHAHNTLHTMYYSIVVEMVEGAMRSLPTDYFIPRNIVPREQILALYFALGDLLSAGTILALHMDGWMVQPGTTRLS